MKLKNFFTKLNDSNDYLLTLSDNSLGVFQSCNKAAEFYTIDRRKKVQSTAAMDAGSAFHQAMEIQTRCSNPDQRKALVYEALTNFFLDHPVEHDEYRNLDYVLAAYNGYEAKYSPDYVKTCKTPSGELMCEIDFKLPLGVIPMNAECVLDRINGPVPVNNVFVEWNGRIDGIVELDGMYWVRDYKTTSMGGSTYFDSFKMSGQPVGYAWAARQLSDLPIAGFLLDCIITRKITKTGKGVEYQRQRYPYSQEKIEEWKVNALDLISDYLSNVRESKFPRRTNSCVGKYGKCSYFNVCSLPQKFRAEALASSDYEDCKEKPKA